MEATTAIRFIAGAHSSIEFIERLLTPLFADGTIPQYPNARLYVICYGELCAYKGDTLLAVWSAEVPDTESDVVAGANYAGTWEPQTLEPHSGPGGPGAPRELHRRPHRGPLKGPLNGVGGPPARWQPLWGLLGRRRA